MAQVVAHKTLRNATIGLNGKPYKVNDQGVLKPQPQDDDRKQILMLRAICLVDEAELSGYHAELVPKVAAGEVEAPARSSVAEVMSLTRALDGVAPVEGVPVAPIDLPPAPDEDAPNTIDYDGLSRDDLLEIARARGLPGLKGKTKAQLLSLVKGT